MGNELRKLIDNHVNSGEVRNELRKLDDDFYDAYFDPEGDCDWNEAEPVWGSLGDVRG